MHTGFLNYFLVPLYNKRHYFKSEQLITLVLVYCISTKICFEEEKKKKIILTYIDFFGFGFDRRFLFFFRFI